MKRLFLIFISALICGVVALTGCNSENEPKMFPTEGLYVIGAKSGNITAGNNAENLIFTCDNIVSFDITTGEIVFAENKVNNVISRVSLHSELHFFIDDKPVFSPPIRIHHGWVSSNDDFDLQFRTDGITVYLTDAYMNIDSLPAVERESIRVEIETNKERRRKELEVFIRYLSDAGKVLDRSGMETVWSLRAMGSIITENQDSIATISAANILVFTEDDIISFNLTTNEIVFNEITKTRISNYPMLTLFFNNERLFEEYISVLQETSNNQRAEGVMFIMRDSKIFLETRNTSQRSKNDFDILIKFLSDIGKTIEK